METLKEIRCPECQSSRLWKDGLRYVNDEAIQRFLCRVCGYRFSESEQKLNIVSESSCFKSSTDLRESTVSKRDCSVKVLFNDLSLSRSKDIASHNVTGIGKGLNSLCSYNSKCQISASEREAKNLVTVERTQEGKAQRERTKKVQKDKGEILSFAWYMQKRGLAEATIKSRMYRLGVLVRKSANLEEPETVETILATSEWSPANKRIFINCYKAYTVYRKIEWQKPKVVVPQKEPFLPLEEEVQQLIAGCGKRTSTLLQLLYETGVRIGEAALLQWTDVDFKTKQLRVNCPEKGGNARTLKLSDVLIAMLKALPKRKDGRLFNRRVRTLQTTFARKRNRLARQLQNPRLKEIHFHTLRHLKATMEYYRTGGDILRVKYVLGHKRLDTTSRYAHYQAFRNEEYIVKRPQTKEEEDQLIQQGFQYVRYDQKYNEAVYRKRK